MIIRYDTQGNEFIIAGEVDGISVGYERYDDGEGNEIRGELRVFDCELYETPPTIRQHDMLVKLNAQISDARIRLNQVRTELQGIETTGKERMEFLKQYQGLQRLEDFLAGRITHFVMGDYGPPKLLTFDKAMGQNEERYNLRGKYKLLTLFGDSKGEPNWHINEYRDGSGIDRTVMPCTSYDEALDVYREKIAEHEAEAKERPNVISESWIAAADTLGLRMSDWYVDACRDKVMKARAAKITILKKQLADLGE